MDVPRRRSRRATEDLPSSAYESGATELLLLISQRMPQNILTILPAHLLVRVLSFLDRPSLCTARLVCRAFCQAASESIRTLRLPPPPARAKHPGPNHGLHRFPLLEAVECSTDLELPHQPETPDWLEEHVTAVTIKGRRGDSVCHLQEFEAAVQATLRLPRLTSLELRALPELLFIRPKAWDGALGPPGATQLRRLCVSCWSPPLLERATQLTRLTMLHLGTYDFLCKDKCPDLGPLSALQSLRELGLESPDVRMVPHQFSGLQGLTWMVGRGLLPAGSSSVDPRAPFLKTMSALRSLELSLSTEQQLADLITMSQLCALTLQLDWCPPSVRRPVSLAGAHALSRLTSLGIISYGDGAPLLVSEGEFPALQQLTLHGPRKEGLLRLAPLFHSSITKLVLVAELKIPLSKLLTRLPKLRALELLYVGKARGVVPLLTGPLRRLTELVIMDGWLDDSHAHRFTNLQELRSLNLDVNVRITGAFLRHLTGLTQLSRLSLKHCSGVRPEDALVFRNSINAARAAFGWPSLEVVWKPI